MQRYKKTKIDELYWNTFAQNLSKSKRNSLERLWIANLIASTMMNLAICGMLILGLILSWWQDISLTNFQISRILFILFTIYSGGFFIFTAFGGGYMGKALAQDWAKFKSAMKYLRLHKLITSAVEIGCNAEEALCNAFTNEDGKLYVMFCDAITGDYKKIRENAKFVMEKLQLMGYKLPVNAWPSLKDE